MTKINFLQYIVTVLVEGGWVGGGGGGEIPEEFFKSSRRGYRTKSCLLSTVKKINPM